MKTWVGQFELQYENAGRMDGLQYETRGRAKRTWNMRLQGVWRKSNVLRSIVSPPRKRQTVQNDRCILYRKKFGHLFS